VILSSGLNVYRACANENFFPRVDRSFVCKAKEGRHVRIRKNIYLDQKLYEEEFEDSKGIIRIRKSKNNRQHNGQKKKDKRTNNDLQNISYKTKDRVTRIPLKTGVNSGAPEG
jgi:hypothetical protein